MTGSPHLRIESQKWNVVGINQSQDIQSPALTRALEMLRLPMGNLPREALIYAGYLCLRVGMCLETLLSAYATYAQIIEDLPCNDDLYLATPTIRTEWDGAQRDYTLVTVPNGSESPRLRVQRRDQAPCY